MRGPASALIAFLCLTTLGASFVADPPNRLPPAPPSTLITIADHLSIQPGQEVTIPVHVNGWQHFTLFYEAVLPAPDGTPDDAIRCVYLNQFNGLGNNLDQVPGGFSGGTGLCVSNGGQPPAVPHKGLQCGDLFGPNFVLTIGGADNLGAPATISVRIYLH